MESASEISANIQWTDKLEEYLASTGEKAHCLSWVHKRSEQLYSTRRTFIDMPVIIGSGVIAFLNAGSSTMFDDPKISSIALGIGSLVVGILNTTGTYFGWAKRAEGHRISAIHYSKLYRFITVELSLPREERMKPSDFLKYVKDQYDRLQEISPLVPPSIINDFQKRFEKYTDISKPEEANGLEKIEVYHEAVGLSDVPSTPQIKKVPSATEMKANPMFKAKAAAAAAEKVKVVVEESEKST
jgi:hypothetical protein